MPSYDLDGGTLASPEAIEQLLTAQRRNKASAGRDAFQSIARDQLRDVDFTFQPSLRREPIENLHEFGFVERGEELDLPRPTPASARRTWRSVSPLPRQSGRRVHYGTLAGLITSLEEAQAADRLQARLKVLTHPHCSSSTRLAVSR
jgi:IstB-like ATP binding protein